MCFITKASRKTASTLIEFRTFAFLVLVVLGLSGSVAAEDNLAMKKWRAADADRDGKVTLSEFYGSESLFKYLDLNKDGVLTEDEVLPTAKMRENRANEKPLMIPASLEYLPNIEYGRGGGKPLFLDILRPKEAAAKPRPVIMFVHGGGWFGGGKTGHFSMRIPFAQEGYFCASVDYRLSYEAAFPAQIEDCKCAIRFLRANAEKYGLDPDRIGVWGPSSGGHLVALLGTAGDVKELEGDGGWAGVSSRVQAVCDWFGPTQFAIMEYRPAIELLMGGPREENLERLRQASSITHVSSDDAPFLIMHGMKDDIVPYEQSVLLKDALAAAGVPVEISLYENAGHGGEAFKAPETTRLVKDFFDRQLKGKKWD